MKKFLILSISLLIVSSLVYADVISDLQTKKNNTQKTGISYTVVIPGEDEGDFSKDCIITEKGNAKLFETSELGQQQMILLSDNKLYQVPALLKTEKQSPVPVMVLSGDAKSGLDEKIEKFKVPDYKDFKVAGKATVNGYPCQILTKIILSEQKETEDGEKFLAEDSVKVYVIEKYGYPTKIEFIFTSKNMKGKVLHNEIQNTINFVKFNTNISDKILSLPKNAMVIDPLNKNSFDPNAIKNQYMKKLHEQYDRDDE